MLAVRGLSITLPTELSELTSLYKLDKESNSIRGTNPKYIFNMKYLKSLLLYGNYFSGKIYSGFGKNFNLEEVSLSGNCFERTIPDTLGRLNNLGKQHTFFSKTVLLPSNVSRASYQDK